MAYLSEGPDLLDRAVGYGLDTLALVTRPVLHRSTPCAGWDVRTLLVHLRESLITLRRSTEQGTLVAPRPARVPAGDPATAAAGAARDLLAAWHRRHRAGPSAMHVAGRPVPALAVETVAALEIAVHGWDVSHACGTPRVIPVHLALDILRRGPAVVDDSFRPQLFAASLPISPLASPSDRLLAFLGRSPRAPVTGC